MADPKIDQILTLIANPRARNLDRSALEAACDALLRAGGKPGAPVWLDQGVAGDVPFTGVDPAVAETVVREALADAPYDLAAQPASGRRKGALVADMDSTIVTSETLDDMAEAVGLKDVIAEITARAMNGELDFADALRERVRMLAGLPESAVAATLEQVALNEGARTLVRTMKAYGATTALVSGGFTAIAEPVGQRCGFDRVVANRLLIEDGRLTGNVGEPILGKEAKLATLHDVAAAGGVDTAGVCAVGDGANDLPMLLAAGLGVAFRAKPSVRAEAHVRVDHGDLTALLYLQGYRGEDFIQ
ncbi:phosphoserine phosphatase SerB [Ferruginivarius sediminum]|uniref:phosphoserine phosphatase SerB n=1 Tax=Ferruginivarius sediminum TaxID=2661937 RepID=UPI001F4ECA0B|nr:phosphoserine phosphatase SerB [Ferruginivarius sediminum]